MKKSISQVLLILMMMMMMMILFADSWVSKSENNINITSGGVHDDDDDDVDDANLFMDPHFARMLAEMKLVTPQGYIVRGKQLVPCPPDPSGLYTSCLNKNPTKKPLKNPYCLNPTNRDPSCKK